jgi:hypothetical protein
MKTYIYNVCHLKFIYVLVKDEALSLSLPKGREEPSFMTNGSYKEANQEPPSHAGEFAAPPSLGV